MPYCTACGALRAPLATPSINLAGKPAKMGGTVASVAGGLVLLTGLSASLGLGLLLWLLFPGALALSVSLPLAFVAAVVGLLLLRGGRSLRRSGADAEQASHDQALLSMAAHQGPVTAVDAARQLNVTVAAADAMLTALAKREPERIAVDVDDQGVVWYRIARAFSDDATVAGAGARVRIDPARDLEAAAAEEAEDAARARPERR